MGLFIGSKRPTNIILGTDEVSKVYVGTKQVWQKQNDIWEYFNEGYVNGIEWSTNALPTPNPTTYGEASLNYVESEDYMRLRIRNGNTSTVNHTSIATTNLITIPEGATKLNIYGSAMSNSPQIRFGLFPANAPDSNDTSNGGVQSGLVTPTATYQTQTLDLPSGYAGSSLYRIVIAARGAADRDRYYRIKRVWFT